jgi:hypothetical protein
MKVKELIELLKEYPEEDSVFIDGYEYGVEDILPEKIYHEKVYLDVDKCSYSGPHSSEKDLALCSRYNQSTVSVNGVIFSRHKKQENND